MSDHMAARCPVCYTGYLIPKERGYGITKLLADGARCIAERRRGGKGLCGAPLNQAQWANLRDPRFVTKSALLGFEVVRPGSDPKVVELEAEVARLREKYETPCKGLAKIAGGVGKCGGFLGHPGDCAEVW